MRAGRGWPRGWCSRRRTWPGAQLAAQAALEERRSDESRWSLGVLRPLTPMAPGTHRYRATFALWEAGEDRFVRRDVHELEVWAADAQSARRLAQQEIRMVDRLRAVLADPPGGPHRRRARTGPGGDRPVSDATACAGR